MGAFFMTLFIFMHWRYVKHDVPWFQEDHQTIHKKAYILTQSYGGQMTRAMRNMLVQQCWAGFLKQDTVITEPFSIESQLVHGPILWNKLEKGRHAAARFGDYYNLTYYNEQSLKHGSAQLIRWETFLASAPRMAVAVQMPTHSCRGVIVKWDCSFSKSFKSFVDALKYSGFNVVRRICLICSSQKPPKLEDLSKLLFNISRNISVVMDSWRNYRFTSNWMDIPDYCKMAEQPHTSNSFLAPSDLVLQQSSLYIDQFIKKKNYIGIMLRIERFLTVVASGRSQDSVQSCLNKTITLLEKIRSEDLGVYVTVDIGKFGSGVMQKKGGSIAAITKSVESLFTHLYNTKFSLESWEETFVNVTGGISERGYIAMVQRNIADQADCLILMGGGSFQQTAGFQYLANARNRNRTPCIHTVCTLDSFSKLFKM